MNCMFHETGVLLEDNNKIVVVALHDIDGSPEKPVELWAD